MNIKDIKYYCSLVEEKNFSKVAEIFKVSQPTITMAIKRLEKEFDAPFFIRDQSHRELRITTAGEQFYMHAQAILTEIEVAGSGRENPLWLTTNHRKLLLSSALTWPNEKRDPTTVRNL